ncbi:hypothetical protein [Hymenobacter glacieicola]|uniref:hypothetical protein n=1 Tax=Hymenobacter glacieicola TaxID=1562124 RepID=UPI00166E02B6|nr:hypothetical protein [Hymenobacter glacieicola]
MTKVVLLQEALAKRQGVVQGFEQTSESLKLMSGVAFRDGHEVKATILREYSKKLLEHVETEIKPILVLLTKQIENLNKMRDEDYD